MYVYFFRLIELNYLGKTNTTGIFHCLGEFVVIQFSIRNTNAFEHNSTRRSVGRMRIICWLGLARHRLRFVPLAYASPYVPALSQFHLTLRRGTFVRFVVRICWRVHMRIGLIHSNTSNCFSDNILGMI